MTATQSSTWRDLIEGHLGQIYDRDDVDIASLAVRLVAAIGGDRGALSLEMPAPVERWNESDAVLITYGNTFNAPGEAPLRTLDRVVGMMLDDGITMVHVLPFSPFSSDDGFAVIDPWEIDSDLGTWSDLEALASRRGLMADLVVNHLSASSPWFQDFVAGVEPGRSWFVTAEPDDDLTAVVRPRQHDLLRPVETAEGLRYVWCTFSHDQVDVDVANPDVLVELTAIVGRLVAAGARFVRLDAIAFLWKEVGTACVHLPQTHEFVRLLRTLLAVAAPHAVILTETNVAHAENLSYLGDGSEAHMAYNFSLPPLTVLSLLEGDASAMNRWLADLGDTPPGTTLLSFLACHDGIGVRPLQGLIADETLDRLAAAVIARGGEVSMASTPAGPRPYELNTTMWSALADIGSDTPLDLARFLAAHTLMLSVRGVPALYVHSVLGSSNFTELRVATGRARSLNRGRLAAADVEAALSGDGRSAVVAAGLRHLLRARRAHPAFHPEAAQSVVEMGDEIVALRRTAADGRTVIAVHNVSRHSIAVDLPSGVDLLTGEDALTTALAPYECRWIAED